MEQRVREFSFTRQDFDFLRRVSNARTGIVVGDDKFDMFYSRISRRVRSLGLTSFADYCQLIREEKQELEVLELVNAITTNLTAFFRENHHFEYLSTSVIPELLRRNAASRELRIWSAGCSTGEEPYSIGMALREHHRLGRWRIDILATDIDSNVLTKAASAVYPQETVSGIPADRLRRWFLKGTGRQAGMVRVKPEIRQSISFDQLNLIDHWRLDHAMDVIFCRNVLIYFDKQTKTRLVDRFADALTDRGYMYIGHSESLFNISKRFELIGNTIYRKKD